MDALTTREHIELEAPVRDLLARFSAGEPLSHSEFDGFAAECEAEYQSRATQTRKLAAFQWLNSQRGLSEAFRSLNRAERRRYGQPENPAEQTFAARVARKMQTPSRESVIENMGAERRQRLVAAGELESAIEIRRSRKYLASGLEFDLRAYRDRVAFQALRPIAAAFKDYFHYDRPAQLRALRASLNQLERVGGELRRVLVHDADESEIAWSVLGEGLKSARRTSERLMRPLGSDLHRVARAMKVAARNDQQAKERLLVHDLLIGLRRLGRRPGAAAITELLTCDGIVNRLDLRTIERLLAKWKAAEAVTKSD